MYANGEGVPQDYDLAHMWLNLSRAGGDYEASDLLEALESEMTRKRIAAAQKLAREWHDQHRQQAEEE